VNTTDQPGIRAAGAVLWSHDTSGGPLLAMVHRPHHNDWSLPKGKIDPGETAPITAVREIHEETGYHARLGPFLQRVHYEVPAPDSPAGAGHVGKTVDYFSALAVSGEFRANSEVDELRWLPAADALALTSYSDDVTVIRSFLSFPPDTTTVLLVTPVATAVSDPQHGDNTPGQLSESGLQQTEVLCPTLRAFAPSRVLASATVGCSQPMGDCARRVGLGVEPADWLSEAGYAGSGEHVWRQLNTIARYGETTVVCGEHDVITDLVGTVAHRNGVRLTSSLEHRATTAEIAATAGSLWQLSLRASPAGTATGSEPPELVRASYFQNPMALSAVR